MTLLVGMNIGDYGIIAADKKEVVVSQGIIAACRDDVNKIVQTDMGLITGSGYAPLLNKVKQEVARTRINHTDQLIGIMQAQRALAEVSLNNNPNPDIFLENTGWLYSYWTRSDTGIRVLRIAFNHPSLVIDKVYCIGKNTAQLVFPWDVSKDDGDLIQSRINSELVIHDNSDGINESIRHNLGLVLSATYEVSRLSETVSKTCDIGLITIDGDLLIANNVCIDDQDITFTKLPIISSC